MSYLNSVTLVGFVGADPEQRQARSNGAKFTVLSVATQRSWKKRAGRVELKNRVAPHLHLPSATGRTRRYGDQEGRARPRRKASSSAAPTSARTARARSPRRPRSRRGRFAPTSCATSTVASPSRKQLPPETARWRRPTALHSEAVFFQRLPASGGEPLFVAGAGPP